MNTDKTKTDTPHLSSIWWQNLSQIEMDNLNQKYFHESIEEMYKAEIINKKREHPVPTNTPVDNVEDDLLNDNGCVASLVGLLNAGSNGTLKCNSQFHADLKIADKIISAYPNLALSNKQLHSQVKTILEDIVRLSDENAALKEVLNNIRKYSIATLESGIGMQDGIYFGLLKNIVVKISETADKALNK